MIFVHVELLIVNRSTRARFGPRIESRNCCPAEPVEGITHCVDICICMYVYIYIYIGLHAQVPLASAGSLTTLDKVYPHNQESLGTQLQWAHDLMTSWSEMDHSQGKKCTVASSRLKECIV